MSFSVTLDFRAPSVGDLTMLHILESATEDGIFVEIDSTNEIGAYPSYISSFTTDFAQSYDDWFAIRWSKADGSLTDLSVPIRVGIDSTAIMASLNDINANLPSDLEIPVVMATPANVSLLQISVARVIRGYLSRIIDNSTLVSWTTPDVTPEIIREIAGKLIASQLYVNEIAKQSDTIEDNSFSQRKYDEAIALLNQIISGEITVPDVIIDSVEGLTLLDGFPIDDTDRAFTMNQIF